MKSRMEIWRWMDACHKVMDVDIIAKTVHARVLHGSTAEAVKERAKTAGKLGRRRTALHCTAMSRARGSYGAFIHVGA